MYNRCTAREVEEGTGAKGTHAGVRKSALELCPGRNNPSKFSNLGQTFKNYEVARFLDGLNVFDLEVNFPARRAIRCYMR